MNEALDAWFVREILPHEGALVRYFTRNWPARDEIHDLRQETYLRVYEAAAKATPRVAKAFLFTTARHLVIDRLRRQKVVSFEPGWDLERLNVLIDEISPERCAAADEDLRRLAQAFNNLPPRCRQVVWMRRVEDQSQKEVAARLGIGEAMVEKHIAKAMRRLADALYDRHSSEKPKGETANTVREDPHDRQLTN